MGQLTSGSSQCLGVCQTSQRPSRKRYSTKLGPPGAAQKQAQLASHGCLASWLPGWEDASAQTSSGGSPTFSQLPGHIHPREQEGP